MSTTSTNPAEQSTFRTPSGKYFASAADAAFWTKAELERAARDAARREQHEARQQRSA